MKILYNFFLSQDNLTKPYTIAKRRQFYTQWWKKTSGLLSFHFFDEGHLCNCQKKITIKINENSHHYMCDDSTNNKRTRSVNQSGSFIGLQFRLKELLRIRLVECGWKDQMQMFCRDVVKEKGVNIKVEELIAEVTPKARGKNEGPLFSGLSIEHDSLASYQGSSRTANTMVPDTVKKELLQKIKSYLSQD